MLFRSLFGWMIRGVENPELILRQYMEDMRDRIPRLNEQAAQIIKLEKMLEQQALRQRANVADLQPKVEQAVKMGAQAKDAALSLIQALESAKTTLAETEAQLAAAQANSKQVLEARTAYERQIRQKINEAMQQIGRHQRAQMERQMAQLMTSFQVGDDSDALDRMREKVDEEAAAAAAHKEVAGQTVEAQITQVETATANTQAETLYAEYQRQLGLVPDTTPPERTMEAIPLPQEQAAEQKPPATTEQAQQ
jgi:phage shock protein A